MPIYKNWQDFCSMRNKRKVLVIYGAGESGKHLLNVKRIVPNYFCDKNAKWIKDVKYDGGGGLYTCFIKCLTLPKLLIELNGRATDILVSCVKEKDIKKIHEIFERTILTEDTVIYFYPSYNIITKTMHELNFKYNLSIMTVDMIADGSLRKYFNLFKKALIDSDSLSFDEYRQRFYDFKVFFKNGRARIRNLYSNQKRTGKNQTVYLFGDSRFVCFHNAEKYKIDSILLDLLDKNENVNYNIDNCSFPTFNNESIIFQLTAVPLVRSSVVIISSILEPYLLAIAKQYCKEYDCRLIYYYFPSIIFKRNFSCWEKFCIEFGMANFLNVESQEKIKQKTELIVRAMDIEFHELPDEILSSDKTIFVDSVHYSDYGTEIIAKHLHDIITNKIKPDNFYCNFHIEPKKKIEWAMSIMPKFASGIQIYLDDLKKHKQNSENCGAIVMNCNPFTLGHRYLIEYAASKVEHLYIFVVEEDRSEFSFADRYMLVKENIADLKNITVLPSGKFIISSLTFEGYFGKSEILEEYAGDQDVSSDLTIFAAAIAPALNIAKRFVGQEPFDPVTRHYNEEMKKLLPEYGCEVIEIPRLEENENAVSASRVRKLLKERDFEEIGKIVPKATLRYLKRFFAGSN